MEQFHSARHDITPPLWYWCVAVVALIWNLLGVGAYFADAVARLSRADQLARAARPGWYMAAYAIAVTMGFGGCVALLIRKKWALMLFATSFIAVILQQIYHFVLTDIGKSLQEFDLGMAIMIPVVAALLLWLSFIAPKKGWLI